MARRKNFPCSYLGCVRKFTSKQGLSLHIKRSHSKSSVQSERYIPSQEEVNIRQGKQLFKTQQKLAFAFDFNEKLCTMVDKLGLIVKTQHEIMELQGEALELKLKIDDIKETE